MSWQTGAAGLSALRESLPDDPTVVLQLCYEDRYGDVLDLPERLARLLGCSLSTTRAHLAAWRSPWDIRNATNT
jgi:hypothetical protein